MADNTLFYGDNLDILREYINTESIDLIYLDPPFNSNRDYNVLFKEESGKESAAQITAFEDTWHWNIKAEETYQALITESGEQVSSLIGALRQFIGTNQMMAYLVMMAARLIELHRVLKPTGSLYLHCDPTASHYLKIVLDSIFSPQNFRNEIIWQRTSSHNDSNKWASIHDTVLFYSKSPRFTWNDVYTAYDPEYVESFFRHEDDQGRYRLHEIIRTASMGPRPNLSYEYRGYKPEWGWRCILPKLEAIDKAGRLTWSKTGRPYLKRYLAEQHGTPISSIVTDIPPIGAQAAERLGYPTQKPLVLLERIIQASSNEGEVVLDPFCGCGTSIAAAQKLGRHWLGIDVTHLSIALQKYRLKDAFGLVEKTDYRVVGEPEDLGSAQQLAQDDRYQFQWWALSLIKARPLGGAAGSKVGKKGSDKGIDGVITFIDETNGKPKRILVQVKSGHVTSRDIRDFGGTLKRENAVIGVFITLASPSKEMNLEAAAAGFYTSPGWEKDYPMIQILTIEQLLAGAEVKMPPSSITFKAAERENIPVTAQGPLFEEADDVR